ncbi:MAG: hypothetical protein NT165_00485 [Candidatus Falkowbacteria bacterium]|nr:hypothetical protein [Candidatus Falkowbacteria bacterium]
MTELKKEKPEVKTEWFAEPLDADSNQGIAFELAKTCEIDVNRLADKGGKMHDLYRLRAYSDVSMIRSGATKFSWKVKIWKRKGSNAIIEEWIFPKKKKKVDLKLVKV